MYVALAAALAGCLADPPMLDEEDDVGPGPAFAPFSAEAPTFDFSSIIDPDHGAHADAALHADGHGFSLIGHTGVGGILPPGMKGSITQIDVWEGYAVVAGMEGGPAFVILDLTDPTHPKPISYAPTIARGWTARFSDDGQYVFYGCQTYDFPEFTPAGAVKGDCTDPDQVHGRVQATAGVSVWDVSDKTRPRFVDFLENPGSHNIYTRMIDGVDYVFTSNVTILKFDRDAGRLALLTRIPGRHDVTVAPHPVTGDLLLYTGTRELAIYDVDDPTDPQMILEPGEWHGGDGWHDQTAFPFLVDGRALLAIAGETRNTTGALVDPTGRVPHGVPDAVTLVDITDPANPLQLSTWQPPFSPSTPWLQYSFSAHEMAATPQGQLSVAWYHAGVWLLDVSTKERQEHPVLVAAYQPHEPINVLPSSFQLTPLPFVPYTWNTAWDERGYLVVSDMHTGVYVLEPPWGLHPVLDSGS